MRVKTQQLKNCTIQQVIVVQAKDRCEDREMKRHLPHPSHFPGQEIRTETSRGVEALRVFPDAYQPL
jgi:hypothetical protein